MWKKEILGLWDIYKIGANCKLDIFFKMDK